MTREEEIRNKAKNKYPYIKGLPQTLTHKEIFIEGAKWADKTMIEKAINWLENTDFDMEYWNNEDGFCKRKFINDFRKAMNNYEKTL